jgi:membrane dipeptidase
VTALPLTRRRLFRGALGTMGAFLLEGCSGIERKRMAELDPRVPALLDRTISVDMHTHAAGAGFAREARYDIAARMREGHMTAVCLCHSADGPVIRRVPTTGVIKQYRDPLPGELHTFTGRRLDFMDALVVAANGLTRVLTPADLVAAKAAGRPALIGTIEGCQFMDGKLERVEEVYRRGIRQLQIVHYMPSDLGDQQTEPGKWGGLSPLGAEVIRECNRLGIVVDVAHGTYQLVEQAAQISAMPFVLSHTSLARGPLRPYSRFISVDHARLMAQAGGVIGVWPNGNIFPDTQAWVADIARLVDVAGVDHVGIGTDMEGGVNELWASYADLPSVANLLLKQGFTPEEASKLMGGNYVRIFTKVANSRSDRTGRS